MIFRFRSFLKAESIADQPVVSARERPAEPTGNRIAKSETLDDDMARISSAVSAAHHE